MKFTTISFLLSAAAGVWAEHPMMAESVVAPPVMVHSVVTPPAMVHSVVTVTAPAAHVMTTVMAMESAEENIMTTTAAMVHTTTAEAAVAAAATHTVVVGGTAGLVYDPSEVTAAVGDVVKFVMLMKNHTVTQSTFDTPCVRMVGGVDSGFIPNAESDAATAPTFEYAVGTTDATWWYCRQRTGTHCGKGMVFAINPTAEKSFVAFKDKAIAQNGTDAAATTAPPPASVPVTLTVDNGNAPPASTTSVALIAQPTATMIAPGWNNQPNAGACSCACFCGVGAFPAGDGVGAYGGYAGSLPAPWG